MYHTEHQLYFDLGMSEAVLLSMRPQPYQMIQAGQKQYEYRRQYVKCRTTAILYVSTPVMAICGVAELGIPVYDGIERIAEIAEGEHTGWGASTLAYLAGLDKGYAVPILTLRACSPVSLRELRAALPRFAAPQSYLLLRNHPELSNFLCQKGII